MKNPPPKNSDLRNNNSIGRLITAGLILCSLMISLTFLPVAQRQVAAGNLAEPKSTFSDKPLTKEELIEFVKKLKEALVETIEDEDDQSEITKKWDARMSKLVGKTKQQVIDLLLADVKSVVDDTDVTDELKESFAGLVGSDGETEKPSTPDDDESEGAAPTELERKFAEQIWVGRGYDVMDKYASVDSIREQIFSLKNDDVEIDENPTTKYDEYSGKSLAEYQSSFSNKLSIEGRYKIFSASVSVNFGKNDASSTAKEFLTMSHYVTLRSYKLPYDVKPLVRPEAQKFIDTASPNEIFRRFGTHFLWQYDVGGRADYNITLNKATSDKDISLEVSAKAAVQAGLGSLSVENDTKYTNSIKKMEENGTVAIMTYGGSVNSGAKLKENRAALAEWAESVEAKPTLCGFGDRSLRGIWTLASTPERQKELEKAFGDYAEGKGIKEAVGKLTVKRTSTLAMVGGNWYSRRSEVDKVGIYQPIADPDAGWYVVGHSADQNNNPSVAATVDSILVKEVGVPSGTLLKVPLSYSLVYTDKGTRAKRDWSIWRANCPVGYVALGYFTKYEHDPPNLNFPSENPFKDVRCVSEKFVERAPVPNRSDLIYNGQGAEGATNIMIYRLRPTSGSVNGNFFFPHTPGSFSDPVPGNQPLYVLKNPNP